MRVPRVSRTFGRVLAGEGFSVAGDVAFEIAIAWYLLSTTGRPSAVAIAVLLQVVPRGVLVLAGGVAADRLSPVRLLTFAHLFRFAVTAALGVGSWFTKPGTSAIYFAAFGLGLAGAVSGPAAESIIPTVLDASEWESANGLRSFAEQAGIISGPVLGGLMVHNFGLASAVGFNSLSFLFAAFMLHPFLATNRSAEVPKPTRKASEARSVLSDVRSGARVSLSFPLFRISLLVISAAALSYSGLFAIGLPVLARHLGNSSLVLGVLVSSWGIGQLLGSISSAVTGLPTRLGLFLALTSGFEAVTFSVLGFTSSVVIISMLLIALGFVIAYSTDVGIPILIQRTVPLEVLARANSLLTLPRVFFEPLSVLALGFVLQSNLRLGFLLAASPSIVVCLVLLMSATARGLRTPPSAR